ncbi:MAG TPA: ATP-binding cassette domain-containing protein, partial [Bacillota bacterium]|nr:ATP-binding cassette domain-containing protein [Bacillota bacterium]
MNCIEIKQISKNYGNVHALDQVDLRFEENKIYGLFGRNGVGKTTLLNIITGRIFADSGEVTVDGEVALENDQALQKKENSNQRWRAGRFAGWLTLIGTLCYGRQDHLGTLSIYHLCFWYPNSESLCLYDD